MKKIIIFLSIITLLISCEPTNTAKCHKIITVVNKTNKKIYVDHSFDYPETDFRKLIGDPLNSGAWKIEANSTNDVLSLPPNCYEAIYPSRIKSGIMMVYVFDGPTLETQGWDYIKANNLVLKRYDLTLKDLKDMNWTITYDGN
jgi:hypothetical protein